MDEKELGSIRGWFAGRLPDGWFTNTEVVIEDDQIVVIGTLPDAELPGTTPEEREGAAAGRIARFRDETRGQRITIAQEAEGRFGRFVTWAAKLGGVTKRFTPGGSGRSHGRRGVMIGHRWGRRGPWGRRYEGERSTAGPASQSEPQVF